MPLSPPEVSDFHHPEKLAALCNKLHFYATLHKVGLKLIKRDPDDLGILKFARVTNCVFWADSLMTVFQQRATRILFLSMGTQGFCVLSHQTADHP